MVLYIISPYQSFDNIIYNLNIGDTIRGLTYSEAMSRIPEINENFRLKNRGLVIYHDFAISFEGDLILIVYLNNPIPDPIYRINLIPIS
jgi:hypothetical protein